MKKPCSQVVTPTVDNSEIECEEYTMSKCVRLNEKTSLISKESPNLNDFIKVIDTHIDDYNTTVRKLYTLLNNYKEQLRQDKLEIRTLKTKIANIESRSLSLENKLKQKNKNI